MPQPVRAKVIFFDAAGTLIHLPRGAAWHYVQVAGKWGITLDEAAVGEAFGRAWKDAPPPVESRTRRVDDDKGWWRDLVRDVLLRCQLPPERWPEDFFDALYNKFAEPGIWELYDDVIPTLESLRGTYRLGIVSNFDGRLRTVLQHLGIDEWFQFWTISSEVGADKPSVFIFDHALTQAGVRPDEALHVGDDPACDWTGGREAGLHVYELKRPERSLNHLREAVVPW